MNLAGGMRTRD